MRGENCMVWSRGKFEANRDSCFCPQSTHWVSCWWDDHGTLSAGVSLECTEWSPFSREVFSPHLSWDAAAGRDVIWDAILTLPVHVGEGTSMTSFCRQLQLQEKWLKVKEVGLSLYSFSIFQALSQNIPEWNKHAQDLYLKPPWFIHFLFVGRAGLSFWQVKPVDKTNSGMKQYIAMWHKARIHLCAKWLNKLDLCCKRS